MYEILHFMTAQVLKIFEVIRWNIINAFHILKNLNISKTIIIFIFAEQINRLFAYDESKYKNSLSVVITR